MLDVKFNIDRKDFSKFDRFKKDFGKALVDAVQEAMFFAENKSKSRFDTPGNLHAQSGTLRRSIRGIVEEDTKHIKGILYTNIEYGPPHELGSMMRTRSGSTYMMPRRPFLEPAIMENLSKINSIIINDMTKTLRK